LEDLELHGAQADYTSFLIYTTLFLAMHTLLTHLSKFFFVDEELPLKRLIIYTITLEQWTGLQIII
jgi:hypothetical protein